MIMKNTIVCAIAVVLSPLALGETNSLTAAEKKEGWKLLFDGKSAAGWSSWNQVKSLAWPQSQDAAWGLGVVSRDQHFFSLC